MSTPCFYLSNHRINMFQQCPLAFKYYVLDEIPSKTSEPAIIGSKVHDMIEMFQNDGFFDEIEAYLEKEDLEESHREEVKMLFRNYADMAMQNPVSANAKVHKEMKVALTYLEALEDYAPTPYDDINAHFKGRVDCVVESDEELIIIDYKTGYRKEDSFDQLLLYAWALLNGYVESKPIVRLQYWYIRTKTVEEQIMTEEDFNFVAEKFQRIQKKVTDAIWNNEFDPKPNRYCQWCSYLHKCNMGCLYNEDLGGKSIEQIGQEYIVLEAKLKEYKDMLKEYAKSNECLTLSNGTQIILESKPKSKPTRYIEDVEAFKAMVSPFLGNGLGELDQYITHEKVNMTKITKKLLKAVPEVESLIKEKPGYNQLVVK